MRIRSVSNPELSSKRSTRVMILHSTGPIPDDGWTENLRVCCAVVSVLPLAYARRARSRIIRLTRSNVSVRDILVLFTNPKPQILNSYFVTYYLLLFASESPRCKIFLKLILVAVLILIRRRGFHRLLFLYDLEISTTWKVVVLRLNSKKKNRKIPCDQIHKDLEPRRGRDSPKCKMILIAFIKVDSLKSSFC